MQLSIACSWRLVEAAQSIPNALPNDKSVLNGQNEATWLAQQAKAQGFSVMRLFGIADVNWGQGSALQTSPGAARTPSCCPRGPGIMQSHALSAAAVAIAALACAQCKVLEHQAPQSPGALTQQVSAAPGILSSCGDACDAGQYDETVFKAIDYILDQMSQQGIRVIVAFIDYWKKTDGVQQVRSPGHCLVAVVLYRHRRAACICSSWAAAAGMDGHKIQVDEHNMDSAKFSGAFTAAMPAPCREDTIRICFVCNQVRPG